MDKRLAAVGEITEDRYLGTVEERYLGGISCNFARAANATLFSVVGDDDTGARAKAQLTIPHEVSVCAGKTPVQNIRLHAGEREFCGYDPGVLLQWRPSAAQLARINTFDAVHIAMQPETAHLREGITAPVVADFSIDNPMELVTDGLAIAFVGGRREQLPSLLQHRCLVVLTCGADGAYAVNRGVVLHQPALPTTVIDTTGCGDAFAGAFCRAYFNGASLSDALHAGARRAARVAQHKGACSPGDDDPLY